MDSRIHSRMCCHSCWSLLFGAAFLSFSMQGSDFICHAGYDAIIQRLRDGRQMCKDVEELFKMRALAEEKYGKELVTIAHKAGGSTEISTMRVSFEQLKTQIENIGNFHIQLSDKLKEEVKKMETFREHQKEQRKKFESIMEKIQKKKVALYKKTMESKKNYDVKCKEANEVEQGAEKTNAAAKNPDKLRHKTKQCRQAANEAEKLYMNNIHQLEEIRQDWEETHKSMCEVFQELEGDRISTVRCALWDHCNHFSMQCVKDDELYEEVRTFLEQCDIVTDNNSFIKMKSTGSRPPEPIVFESYYQGVKMRNSNDLRNSNSSEGEDMTARFELNNRRESRIDGARCFDPLIRDSITSDNDRRISQSTVTSTENNKMDESGYAALPGPSQQASLVSASTDQDQFYIVNYDYNAQEGDELSVSRGDVVRLLVQGLDGWWTVERNGCCGLVPGNYLGKI
uniref:Proline-serine-threonine phosphatase interacting protein 1b n=1 Tax=Oryzias latipes TaxID=8090 RepID=A0A3P9LMF5_ORYLA